MYIAIWLRFHKYRCHKRQMLEYPYTKYHSHWSYMVSINCRSSRIKIDVKTDSGVLLKTWSKYMNYWGLGFEQAFEAYLSCNMRRKIRPHPYHESTEEQHDINLKESLITQSTPWGFQKPGSSDVCMLCNISSMCKYSLLSKSFLTR